LSDRADAAAVLDGIADRTMLVFRVDAAGRSYRLHTLLRAYLLADLVRQAPDRAARLNGAAADWYAAHDEPGRALWHACKAGDTDGAGPAPPRGRAGHHPGHRRRAADHHGLPEMTMRLPIPLDDDLSDVAARLRQSTVEVRTRRGARATGHGSGIVWDADGVIVTNAHVAQGARATVTLADGRALDARLVAHDPSRDLATLRLEASAPGLTAAHVGDSGALRPGALVVALGHPLGVAHSLAVGVVHSTDGTPFGRRGVGSVIAADIRLAPGNSGGPLANAAGEVVGVNSMIAAGLGIAIPAATVARFVDAQRPRPRLGVTVRPVTVALRGRPRVDTTGLLVLELTRDGPAARAGLLPGDVLLAVDRRTFAGPDDLLTAIRSAGPGATLLLDVGRGGRRTTVPVTLGPLDDPAAGDRPRRAA
jgi:serine protease Do